MALRLHGGQPKKDKTISSRKIREKKLYKEKLAKNRNLVHKVRTLADIKLIPVEENGFEFKRLERKLKNDESFDGETLREIKELVVDVMRNYCCSMYHAASKIGVNYHLMYLESKKDTIFQELIETVQQEQAEQRLDLAEEVFLMKLQQGDLSAAEKIVTLHKAATRRGWGKLRDDAQTTITVIQSDPDLAAKIEDLRLKSQRMIDVSPV